MDELEDLMDSERPRYVTHHHNTIPSRFHSRCPRCGNYMLDWIRFDSDTLAWVCEGC